MERVPLGKSGINVSRIGLGCMSMSAFYTDHKRTPEQSEQESVETIAHALQLGINFFDTAAIYGCGANERLLGRALAALPYKREEYIVATKCGIDPRTFAACGKPEAIKKSCEDSLAALKMPYIDLFYLHRADPNVPIEETMKGMAELFKEGKIRAVGLSEVKAETLRRANAVFPVTALQSEFSMWTRDVAERTLPTCRELGVSLVAYSPLGRGFLSGGISSAEALEPDDWRRSEPRFSQSNIEQNLPIVHKVQEFAQQKGCTPAQLALAWCLAQGREIVPIPGTKRVKYLIENAEATRIQLSSCELHELNAFLDGCQVHGARYSEGSLKMTDI